MGLDVPDLDDRTYEELLTDARKRIPVADEDWTDHNAHDPGVTILELLAWLSESYRYQLDRIEDRHRRKYAQLLGVTPAGPERATGRVSVAPDGDVAGETVPAGTRLIADDGDAERYFETTRRSHLTEASVAKVVTETPSGRADRTQALTAEGTHVHPFGETAAAGSTCYVGFDGDPFGDPIQPLSLFVEYHDDDLPAPAGWGEATPPALVRRTGDPGPGVDGVDRPIDFEPSVEVVWEYCTDYRAWEWTSAWEPLDVIEDTTDSLYGSGVVTLAHPGLDRWQGVDPHDPGVAEADAGHAWIRARLLASGYEIPPRFDRLGTNVLSVAHGGGAGPERLSRPGGAKETNARPHQRFAFDRSPVRDATIEVGGVEWTAVADFDASGPTDRHYVLDETAGAIQFGDNVRGAVPPAAEPVVATSYAFGAGPSGNVGASTDWRFPRPEPTADDATSDDDPDWAAPMDVRAAGVEPLGPATGGRAAEDVDDALVRLQRDLERPYRAVTADDCEFVAIHTPGLRVARATAVVVDGTSPEDCVDHDAVRVVVVPYGPEAIDRPTPSDGFLDAVQCHLERNRLLTDRVTAVAPTYVGIGVTVEVELEDGTVAERRQAAVRDALDRFLSPLRGFGGDGWPFGRAVYHSELYERVGDVDGVDCVTDVDVGANGPATTTDEAVEIPPTALVAPLEHTVVVRETGRRCGGVRR